MRCVIGSKAPPPPDYQAAAQQQAAASQQNVGAQTQANRANQNTGFGGVQWTQDPKTGQWTQTAGLNGPLAGAQGEAQNSLLSALGQPIDTGSSARDQAVSAMYNAQTAYLDPQFRQAQQAEQAQLANQGLAPTSEAARAANNAFGQQQNQAYAGALANAQQLGNQAQQITFGENLAARQEPLQELGSLLGLEGQQGYNQAGLAESPQYLAAAMGLGNYNLGAAQMQNQAMGSLGSGLGSLASAGMSALNPAPVLALGAL